MSVFDRTDSLTKDVVYTEKAPWASTAQNDDGQRRMNPYVSFGAYGKIRTMPLGVKLKLDMLQIFVFVGLSLSLIVLVVGIFILVVGTPGKHGRASHPIIAGSQVWTILTGIALTAVGVIGLVIYFPINNHRKKLFKREVVRRRLSEEFEILDYIYFPPSSGVKIMKRLIYNLNIRENTWDDLKFTDYFLGKFESKPFMFIDIELFRRENLNEDTKKCKMFSGQVILMKLNKPLDFSCSFSIDDHEFNIAPYKNELKAFDQYICGDKPISRQASDSRDLSEREQALSHEDRIEKCKQEIQEIEHVNTDISGTSHGILAPQYWDDHAMGRASDYLMKVQGALHAVIDAAGCDNVGWIMSDGYLVTILENKFDPFEFTSTDIFRSAKKVMQRVDRQAAWLVSIMAVQRNIG